MANKNIGRARILQQRKNMQKDKVDYLHAQPLESDLYTWHFTFRGPENTDFHQGLYHGQILLPFEYPFKPPDIIFANKNGRFEVNTKICLTITQYHTEEWNSAWTIRTMLEAVVSLFNERVVGHGYLESSSEARKFFAKASHEYTCDKCGKISDIVKPRQPMSNKAKQTKEENKVEELQPEEQKMLYSEIERQNSKKAKQQTKIEEKPPRKVSQRQPEIRQRKQQRRQPKKEPKKITPHQFFYQTLLQGNQQYTSVIKSKKLIQE